MRRAAVGCLFLVLLLSVLVACGGDQEQAADDSSAPREAELQTYSRQVEAAFAWLQPKEQWSSEDLVSEEQFPRMELFMQLRYWDRLEKVYRQFRRRIRSIDAPEGIRHAQLERWARRREEACWLFASHTRDWLVEARYEVGKGNRIPTKWLVQKSAGQMNDYGDYVGDPEYGAQKNLLKWWGSVHKANLAAGLQSEWGDWESVRHPDDFASP